MAAKKIERPMQIHFRVTPTEFEMIKKNVKKSGLSISEYGRRVLTGEKVISAPPADFFLLLREIKRVGSNINQILRKINALGIAHSLELERCAKDTHEVINLLYRTYRPGKGDD